MILIFFQFQQSFADNYKKPDTLIIKNATGKSLAQYTAKTLYQTFTIHTLETTTPWSKNREKIRFRGPYLKDILAKHNLDGNTTIEVQAFNDFITLIRQDEIDAYAPILAIEQHCSEQDREDKLCTDKQLYRQLTMDDLGPFYIVWPFEQLPSTYVPLRNSIWVWFVIVLRPGPIL